MGVFETQYLGLMSYSEAHELQKRLVDQRKEGEIADTLLFVEHPPTITLGRGAKPKNILFSEAELTKLGVEVHETGRGGDVTYHGPGQLVAYPIFDLKPDRQDVRKYVSNLEEVMIRTCAEFGLNARRIAGCNGCWIEDRKIGAVGVRISRWVTMHGLAFNVTTDMRHFEYIIPCGITDKGVTSLQAELEQDVPLTQVREVMARAFAEVF